MLSEAIDDCRNLFGRLAAPERARIEAVLRAPNAETWEAARTLIINDEGTTLWQAWCLVDENAPRSVSYPPVWPRIPDTFTLYQAIKTATAPCVRDRRHA